MEERDQALIESYLANELPPEERSQVEKRTAEDPQFRANLQAYQSAMEALKIRERARLKERLQARDAMLDQRMQKTGQRISIRWAVAAAAILFLGFIGWKFLFHANHQNVVPGPGQLEQIFAENFSPFRADMTEPTARGGENISALEQFNIEYWNAQYKEAVDQFDKIDTMLQTNEALRFRYANALMATLRFDEAGLIFQNIISNPQHKYATEAYWYIAMIDIKKGDPGMARTHLQSYVAASNALRKKDAEKILRQLGQ